MRRCIRCAPCPWDFMQSWINMGSWIYGSLYTMLYLCDYRGRSLWCPCTCIGIWCWRWCCLHSYSLWLNMTSGFWILLDSLWDYLLKWIWFCEFLIFLVGCHILIVHRFLLCLLDGICVGWNIFCWVLHVFSIPGIGSQVYCTLSLSILVYPFLLGLCTQKISL